MDLSNCVTAILAEMALALSPFNLTEAGLGRPRLVWPHLAKWSGRLFQTVGVCSSVFLIIQFFLESSPPTRGDIGGLVVGIVSLIFYVVAVVVSALVKAMKSIAEASKKVADVSLRLAGGDPGDSPQSSNP